MSTWFGGTSAPSETMRSTRSFHSAAGCCAVVMKVMRWHETHAFCTIAFAGPSGSGRSLVGTGGPCAQSVVEQMTVMNSPNTKILRIWILLEFGRYSITELGIEGRRPSSGNMGRRISIQQYVTTQPVIKIFGFWNINLEDSRSRFFGIVRNPKSSRSENPKV